ncbi:MAG: LEPR-XLL domain-containing protein, partial [Magnetococcales bacterium]|nr:LEPR-XLL domain-containing protein [Magnetococcales bacterium]
MPEPAAGRRMPIRLETLEPRILLNGDILVQDPLDPTPQGTPVQQLESATTPQEATSGAPDLGPPTGPGGNPLEVVSANGSQQPANGSGAAAILTLNAGDTLVGSGLLAGSLINRGTVAPGASPGVLSVATFEQQSAATLQLEIGGTSPGVGSGNPLDGFDQVRVAGLATLDGSLDIDFMNDFNPVSGQVFDVLTWSERRGSFSGYTGLYAGKGIFLKPVYQVDRLQLVATALPGLANLSIADTPAAQAALDQVLTGIGNAVSRTAICFDAALELSGLRLTGGWEVSVAPLAGNAVETTFVAKGVSAAWSSGGLTGGLDAVSGRLVFADNRCNLTMEGNGRVALSTGDALSGHFALTGDSATGYLQVAADGVCARLGDPAAGPSLELTNGRLDMLLGREGHALRASGDGALRGLPASSLSGSLGFVANTLGRAVNEAFTLNGVAHSLVIADPEPVARCEARQARLSIDGLGVVNGDLAFTSRTSQTETTRVNELLVGARNLQASLTLGDLTLTADQGWLALVLATETPLNGIGAATNSMALLGEMDVRVAVDANLVLTGSQVRVAMNRGSTALAREVLTTGDTLLLDLGADTLQVSGFFNAAIGGVMSFSGDLVLDVGRSTRTLSNGQSVQLLEYALSGSRITARLAAGNGLDVTTSQGEMALVYAKDIRSDRAWLTSRGAMQALTVAGHRFDQVQQAEWNLNRAVGNLALQEGTTLDWSVTRRFALQSGRSFLFDQVGDILTLPVQGSLDLEGSRLAGTLRLTHDRGQNSWQISAEEAQVWLAAGYAMVGLTQASGSLRINGDRTRSGTIAGRMQLSGITGLSLSGTGQASFAADGSLTIAANASAAVTGFGSLSGQFACSRQASSAQGSRIVIAGRDIAAQVGDANARVSLQGASLGLILATDARGQAGYALVAEGSARLEGLEDIASLSAQGRMAINHLGQSLDETLALGNGGSVALRFADERDSQSVVIDQGSLRIAGLGDISGRLRIDATLVPVGATTQQRLAVGFENLQAAVTLGGATASLSQGRGAVLFYKENGTSRYAVQVEGAAALSGIDALTLRAERMQLACNRTGTALETVVATSDGWVGMDLLNDEFRLRGYASAAVAGVVAVEGELFLESCRNQTVALSDASQVQVDTLTIGGGALSATLQAAAVGLNLADVDLALVVGSEIGGAQRRWVTATALVGSAELAGYPVAEVRSGVLDINRALAASPDASGDYLLPLEAPVIDWSAAPRAVVLSGTRVLPVTAAAPRFATYIDGALRLGDARVAGRFDLLLERAADGTRRWEVQATDAEVSFAADGVKVSIEKGTGSLFFGADGNSGSLSGNGSVTGLDGLTLTGTLGTRFAQDRLELAGSLELGMAGYGALSGDFSIIKEASRMAVPVMETELTTPGSVGTATQDIQGGLTTNTRLTLEVTDASGRFCREGLYAFTLDGQTFTASSLDGDTAAARPVSDIRFAERIQEALAGFAAIGAGNVLVTGTRADGFVIEFIGALAGRAVPLAIHAGAPGLWMTQPADRADKPDWGMIEETRARQTGVSEVQRLSLANSGGSGKTFTLSLGGLTTAAIPVLATAGATNERQVLTLTAVHRAAGQFWFGVDGVTTAKIRYSADPTFHARGMREALEAVVGVGNVVVTYKPQYTGHNSIDYVIDFKGALAGRDVSLIKTYTSTRDIQ